MSVTQIVTPEAGISDTAKPVTPLRPAGIFSAAYWREAARNFGNTRMLTFAALIVALRVAVKLLRIPVVAGLSIGLDGYVNALGSLVYGPLMGLAVGAISDTLGCVIAPTGPYFLPFILVEMGSSFIFALFLWKQPLSVRRVFGARFCVSFICNIVLTSVFVKWEYLVFYSVEKAETYALVNGVRIAKNLVLFPLEAVLITLLLGALSPALRSLHLLPKGDNDLRIRPRHIVLVAILFAAAVGLVLLYVFFLKDVISAHNIKLF